MENNIEQFEVYLGPFVERIRLLEEEVFGKHGGGPNGGISARLEDINSRLESLKEGVAENINALDKKHSQKLDEVIEIVAELRDVVARLQGRNRGMALAEG